MRLYGPKKEVADGMWSSPPIREYLQAQPKKLRDTYVRSPCHYGRCDRLLLNALLPRIVAQLRLKDAVAVPAAAALPIEAPHADWG